MLSGNSLEGKREDLKSVGLIAIHLQNPSSILEDHRRLLHNPHNMTGHAQKFIEMIPTATYKELFDVSTLNRQIEIDSSNWHSVSL
jgi:hypothetical protein